MDRSSAKPTKNRKLGPNTRRWVQFHLKYAAPTTYRTDFVWDRSKWAEGPFFSDPDGNIILDFISHVGSSPLGYNYPEIQNLIRSMHWADPDRYAGCDFIAAYGDKPSKNFPTASHLHHKLREITKQLGFDRHFLTNSGAEAVENAIKVCYDYRKNYGYGLSFD
ncbi:MAG: aminotransferase class III-fold pyridoxal phosphate-dependent enzyme, partial [Candidatus Nanoarchaeia archaeon]